ncbi:MAG: T9SS type A sorting domain-containing protein [Bacteroidota bacterium]|nr:T9SS type A sorting domain-containing protein [Bacteroidota bacterium]
MKTTIKSILTITFITLAYFTNAQVNYTYDDNGNRVSRNTVVLKSQPNGTTKITEQKDYLALESNYIEELGSQTITIYPNPTGGAFAVGITNLQGIVEKSMALYSITGKEIFKQQDFNELTEINISTQKSGTYILKILLDNKQTTWKIVKR